METDKERPWDSETWLLREEPNDDVLDLDTEILKRQHEKRISGYITLAEAVKRYTNFDSRMNKNRAKTRLLRGRNSGEIRFWYDMKGRYSYDPVSVDSFILIEMRRDDILEDEKDRRLRG